MLTFIKILFVLVLYVPSSMLNGVILRDLWYWFLIPIGVPAIGIVNAIGISLIISMFTLAIMIRLIHDLGDGDGTMRKYLKIYLFGLFYALITWGFGAVWSLFM